LGAYCTQTTLYGAQPKKVGRLCVYLLKRLVWNLPNETKLSAIEPLSAFGAVLHKNTFLVEKSLFA
jgi:hypothetical protein